MILLLSVMYRVGHAMTKPPTTWTARRTALLQILATSHENFDAGGKAIEAMLASEIHGEGVKALIAHLAFASVIPEVLGHDSSEEKLFSKYTDIVLAHVFRQLGFHATVLDERADAADVDVHASNYAFVADAKAFRLSRTAKNQKDFKVESMDKWRHDKDHALLIAPLFQYPSRSSQIYEQASRRSVCMLSYPHLRAWLRAHERDTSWNVETCVKAVLDCPRKLTASKSAKSYWSHVNGVFRSAGQSVATALKEEFSAESEHLRELVDVETQALNKEVHDVKALSHKDAIAQLLDVRKLPQRLEVIRGVSRTQLFDY